MRKILAVFLTCFILGGLLAGCGGGSGGDQGATPPPGAGGESSGEKRNMLIGLTQPVTKYRKI